MGKLRITISFILFLTTISSIRAQVKYDKTFVNNSVILTILNDDLTKYKADYETVVEENDRNKLVDVIGLLTSSDPKTLEYAAVNIDYYPYKSAFGKYTPESKVGTLRLSNNETTIQAGRIIVSKNDPKKVYRTGGSDARDKSYVLIYNAQASNNHLYYEDGNEVNDSYVTTDVKGRITEYHIGENYYGVEYNGQGQIASIKRWRLEGKGKTKSVKTTIAFSWKGGSFTKITFGWVYDHFPNNYSEEYYFEPTQYNEAGLWTKAIVYHKDANAFEGKAIDFGLSREGRM